MKSVMVKSAMVKSVMVKSVMVKSVMVKSVMVQAAGLQIRGEVAQMLVREEWEASLPEKVELYPQKRQHEKTGIELHHHKRQGDYTSACLLSDFEFEF